MKSLTTTPGAFIVGLWILSISCPIRVQSQSGELVMTARIPETDTPNAPYYLYRPTDVEVIDENTIAIADQGEEAIWILDKEGNLLHKIGRVGEGPGEFRFLVKISYDSETQLLWAVDNRGAKAFSRADWSYVDWFAKTSSTSDINAYAGNVYLSRASFSGDRYDIFSIYDSNGEFTGNAGMHNVREVGSRGRQLQMFGAFDVCKGIHQGTLCFVYTYWNEMVVIKDNNQTFVSIDDKLLADGHDENIKLSKEWKQDASPRPYIGSVDIDGDDIFLLVRNGISNRYIYQIDLEGNVINKWHIDNEEDSIISFVYDNTQSSPCFWMLSIWPNPIVMKYEVQSEGVRR